MTPYKSGHTPRSGTAIGNHHIAPSRRCPFGNSPELRFLGICPIALSTITYQCCFQHRRRNPVAGITQNVVLRCNGRKTTQQANRASPSKGTESCWDFLAGGRRSPWLHSCLVVQEGEQEIDGFSRRLDVEVMERFGNLVVPTERFLETLFVIDDAVAKAKEGTINQYVYDPLKAKLVERTS